MVDQSLVRRHDDFAAEYLELRAVVWDTRSLQWFSVVREGIPIQYPADTRSRWLVPQLFKYGDDSLRPAKWVRASEFLQRPTAGRLSPTQAQRVSHWAQQVDIAKGLEDGLTMSAGNRATDASYEIRHGRSGNVKAVPNRFTAYAQRHTIQTNHHPLDETIPEQARSLRDSLQAENVSDAKDFRKAPTLLKAPKQALPVERDPQKKLDSLLHESIARLLASLDVSRVSPSGLEVQIGQIFTKRSAIPRSYRGSQIRTSEPFSPHEWESVYHSSSEPHRTIFSPKVSGAWQDIEFMSNISDSSRRHLFQSLPQADVSTYMLSFVSEKSGNQAVLKISSDETRPQITPSRPAAGSVNLHFPKQVWDARFAVLKDGDLDRELERDIRPTAETIWIHGGGLNPDLERLYAKRYASHVRLKSAELHREIVYTALGSGKDVSLHLSRVESLQCANLESGFCAFSRTEEDPERDHGLWEAKLASSQINELLTGGANHEIRDLRYWTESAPFYNALVALTRRVVETVNAMDDVGCSSRRKVAFNGATAKAASATSIGH